MEDEKNSLVNGTSPPHAQVELEKDLKIEEAVSTGYVGYVQSPKIRTEQETEADSTGYEEAPEVAMPDDATGHVEAEYVAEPEEEFKEGDRVVDVMTGNRGVVVGYHEGRVVFDNKDFGRCTRPAIMLQKI
jgi:hypothetical protein